MTQNYNYYNISYPFILHPFPIIEFTLELKSFDKSSGANLQGATLWGGKTITYIDVLVIQIEEIKTEVPHTSGINTMAGVSAQFF